MFSDDDGAEVDDSKDLHMGRTRTFEHVAGNWATYLYIPCESFDLYMHILSFIVQNTKRLPNCT